MKARQRAKKFTAVILTLAMLITALPLQVFAYIPGHDTEAGFKNMYMHSAVNQRPIATYMYGDNTNYFNSAATLDPSNPGGLEWMLLTFAIDRNQDVDLLLYRLKGEQLETALNDYQSELVPREDLEPEDFLDPITDSPLYLSVKRYWDNIEPYQAPASEWVTQAPDFERPDLDVYPFEDTESTVMKAEPVYGH